ncbi:hypothetical protein J2X21_004204 [Kinneretia asaccharophila]|uniref:Uncharacterized protein n=1 Tax=Roseateles asaccharophilus TaxID=582607 RepID=A0ABU2ACW9_9BURK|nr:hypothetical protein [Roseateles asaccharophilus]
MALAFERGAIIGSEATADLRWADASLASAV